MTQTTQMGTDATRITASSDAHWRLPVRLGSGFVENVYENALAHELRMTGIAVAQQHGIAVMYDGIIVGEYTTDLLVEDALLIELKAVKGFDDVHLAQCLNYLKATGLHLCLLLNFGKPRLEIKRVVKGL
jgi:GxxExxY protein